MIEVTPFQRYEKDGKTYEYRYRFNKVHIDEVDLTVVDNPSIDARRDNTGNSIIWTYNDNVEIEITEKAVFMGTDENPVDAGRTAYFALNLLDEHGWVSGWRKV